MTARPFPFPTRRGRPSALAAALILGWAALGLAQAPAKPKDEAIDDLLKKVEEAGKPRDTPATVKPDAGPKADSKAKDGGKARPAAKPGAVDAKDKDLDDLLGKLGASKDAPAADDKGGPPPPGGEPGKPDPASGGDGKGKDKNKKDGPGAGAPKDGLSGDDKGLDEHLQELAGKKKKTKPGQKGGQGQGKGQDKGEEDGPLGDLIKQMREVENRLGKPDTGEETRQKQAEIVKRMDTLIEQMRQSQGQSQAMRMIRQGKQPGKPGDQPGAMAQGAGPMRPEKPRPKSVLALDKNAWGHLPKSMRDEMANVDNEGLLPSREDLIKRYYLSVSKKSLTRGE